MDVVLQTNTADLYLGLLGVRRFADGSGFSCELVVRSHGFAGGVEFCPEVARLKEFAAAVAQMDRTLSGTARLHPDYEDGYIELEVTRTGAVIVRGELVDYREAGTHRLQFAFRTDQTCLRPLATDLVACLNMAAV
jgi:hypothetical protein